MALTANRKQQLRRDWSAVLSTRREVFGLSKADLDAAITAVDNWVETNATGYNLALPQAARSGLTAAQKAELLARVALARYGG